jgi:hypothetical protein
LGRRDRAEQTELCREVGGGSHKGHSVHFPC